MKQNILQSLFALKNSQMRQYSESVFPWYSLCSSSGYANSPNKKRMGLLDSQSYPFLYLPEKESLLWEACFKLPKDATESRNWLTQSLEYQQRFR